ncbi:hypothetical protein L195_g033024 [Trifolium pratense]|uniref:Uncharacterized protein n=1 Tax=Trifolium pratense TaxID=57577 RepID=A0A2K3LEU4_TRIPR|nr:hypothetical protein L195_g033024 [Trifolium pratense]
MVVYFESPLPTESKSLCKPKRRTPSDIVRNTSDLLRLLQNSPNNNKRDNDNITHERDERGARVLVTISIDTWSKASLLAFVVVGVFLLSKKVRPPGGDVVHDADHVGAGAGGGGFGLLVAMLTMLVLVLGVAVAERETTQNGKRHEIEKDLEKGTLKASARRRRKDKRVFLGYIQ